MADSLHLDRDEHDPVSAGADLGVAPKGERLGELLVRRGLLSEEQLVQALQRQQASGMRLGSLLVMSGWVTEDALTTAIAEQAGVPVLDTAAIRPRPEVVRMLSEDIARSLLAVPIAVEADGAVVAAVSDPAPRVRQRLEEETGATVRMVVAGPSVIRRLIDEAHSAVGPGTGTGEGLSRTGAIDGTIDENEAMK